MARRLRYRTCRIAVGLLCLLSAGAGRAVAKEIYSLSRAQAKQLLYRVIPLPKEIAIKGTVQIPASQVALSYAARNNPALETAARLLSAFALGDQQRSPFAIRLALVEEAKDDLPAELAARLRALPNAEQAYAIAPLAGGGGLLLTANSDQGLLYAARTLAQLVRPLADLGPQTELTIPRAEITDWPDLAERGQWGGNTTSELAWTSRWKLNVIEAGSTDPALFRQGVGLGVKIVPFTSHLEQQPIPAEFRDQKDIIRVLDPTKPLPSDYRPGLCMSSPITQQLIAKWLDERARIEGVTDISVWLSEDAAPCFCERCRSKEPYSLEVAAILAAFSSVKARHPHVRLRLLTTQGSFPVNDRIIAAVPKDVGITYYDGGRTYCSSHAPMIYPLLEEYAKAGRWLGVYPQITHSWRTVFPWTAPQFIQYRCREFVEKQLSNMIGYAVPSNHYHEFNVMAMAEWTWNAHGRTPEEFCRAYATVTGFAKPELFARWAVKVGEAGWALAESNLLLRLIYDPSAGLKGGVPFDHRFQASAIADIKKLDQAIESAKQSLSLARTAGNDQMVCESECVLAGLRAFGALRSLTSALLEPKADDKTLADSLDQLDQCGMVIHDQLIKWGGRVSATEGGKLPTRLVDTANVLLRTCDLVKELAGTRGVRDPRPESRLRNLGKWSAADFAAGQRVSLSFSLDELVPAEGGRYQVGFDFVDSAYGAQIERVAVLAKDGAQETVVAETPDQLKRISRWERWCEMRLDIPSRPAGSARVLEVRLSGLPPDAPPERRTCSGLVGIRRVGE